MSNKQKHEKMRVAKLSIRDLKKGDLFNFNGIAVAVKEITNVASQSKIEFEYYENGMKKVTAKYFNSYDKVNVIF
jgi:riboflavin synthase alpha subunit